MQKKHPLKIGSIDDINMLSPFFIKSFKFLKSDNKNVIIIKIHISYAI